MSARAVSLAAAAALTVLAAPAGAAYAPRLEARMDPATPASPSALTIAVRQQPGETATRTEVVRYPPSFRFNPGFSLTGCTPQQEADSACPDSSRVGQATADTELGAFSGPVFLTRDFRFVIFLRGFGGLVQQKIEGVVRVGPDGWVETVLDGLPPVRATFSQVRLEPGARSLILTPDACGSYAVQARFTSHQEESVVAPASVQIAGCESRPAIVALTARGVRGRLDVSWLLAESGGRTEIAVDRRVSLSPWVRWQRVRSASAGARQGRNRAVLAGPRGRRLAPGRYRVTLTSVGPRGGLGDTRRIEVAVTA
ncbi:MAG: hypothetical protein QOI91_1600 [Solirubrobacteraceae bacterium]|jgi:hypothetical protein|nr:hypothetical protein [Solirubrobacteraceae bacterium]